MRQVQVFKIIQKRDEERISQNIKVLDCVATLRGYGNGCVGESPCVMAIIERSDGTLSEIPVDLVQFVKPAPSQVSHIGAKWEQVLVGTDTITRLRTPTGWLVSDTQECAHIGNDKNEYITTGYDWRVALTFVPDPDGVWLAAPSGAA